MSEQDAIAVRPNCTVTLKGIKASCRGGGMMFLVYEICQCLLTLVGTERQSHTASLALFNRQYVLKWLYDCIQKGGAFGASCNTNDDIVKNLRLYLGYFAKSETLDLVFQKSTNNSAKP